MKNYLTGVHGIAEAMKKRKCIFYYSRRSKRVSELTSLARLCGVPSYNVTDKEITRMISSGSHRGCVLEIDINENKISNLNDLWAMTGDSSLVIVLDGITDPRNLGAVIRGAEQFSADAVIIPRRRSANQYVDSLSRASAGAIEWVPLIEVQNVNHILKDLKANNYWIWGAVMDGEPVSETNLTGRTVLVMGREGEGLHRLVREGCDGLVSIPTSGKLDSLNVATAAGILMYEVRRQQSAQNFR